MARLGVRLGPISVSGSTRLSKQTEQGCGPFVAVVLIVFGVFLLGAWPYLLLEKKHHSLAWPLEIVWLCVLIGAPVLLSVLVTRSANKRQAELERQQAVQRARDDAQRARMQAALDAQRKQQADERRRPYEIDVENARQEAAQAAEVARQWNEYRQQMRMINVPWLDPAIDAYTHGTCSIRHRSEGAAARCTSTI